MVVGSVVADVSEESTVSETSGTSPATIWWNNLGTELTRAICSDNCPAEAVALMRHEQT
jgi:hypothetical protein